MLSSPMAVKVTGIEAWTQHSRVKAWKNSQDLPDNIHKGSPIAQDTKILEPEYAWEPVEDVKLIFKRKSSTTKI